MNAHYKELRSKLRSRFIAARARGIRGYSEELERIECQLMSAGDEERDLLLEYHGQLSRAVGTRRIYCARGVLQ